MKFTIAFLISFSYLAIISWGQVHFEEHLVGGALTNDPENVFVADIDGDSCMDIVCSSFHDDKIVWFKGRCNGTFSPGLLISSEAYGAKGVYVCDLDGDNDMDILAALQYADKIVWFENIGSGIFGNQNIISSDVLSPASTYACDLDGDSLTDILSASITDNKICWYKNLGNGSWGIQQIISSNIDFAISVCAEDMDSDGDMDVICTGVMSHRISYFENIGGGMFGQEQVVTYQVINPTKIVTVDMDGDNDFDVLSSSIGDGKIAWYPNNGNGTFGNQQIVATSNTSHITIFTADLDGDGDPDVVSNNNSKIVFFKNDGAGNFGHHIPVDTIVSNNRPISLFCEDLNNDSTIDIVFTGAAIRKIAWYENLQNTSFGPQTILSLAFPSPTIVIAEDLDNDTYDDIIAACAPFGITWFKNTGYGNFIPQYEISGYLTKPSYLQTSDINGDGYVDILAAIAEIDTIAWYENNLTAGTWSEHIIAYIPELRTSDDLISADLDNDGDNDIILTIDFEKKLAWYKNDGFGNFGPQIAISAGSYEINSIRCADFDNDNDIDIVAGSNNNLTISRVMWFENDGLGNFTSHIIAFQSIGVGANKKDVYFVRPFDIENDGDVDVLTSIGGSLKYYLNNGAGTFSQAHLIDTVHSISNAVAVDVNLDNNMDIVGTDYSSNGKILWFENNDTSNLFVPHIVSDSLEHPKSICSSDFDHDGDTDLAYCEWIGDMIFWNENTGHQNHIHDSCCYGQTYSFGNLQLSSPGSYVDSLYSNFGLDSIVTLNLSVLPLPNVTLSPFPQDTFCIQMGSIDLPMAFPLGGQYSGPGVWYPTIDFTLAGNGYHEIIYQFTDSTTGCQNSDTACIFIVSCSDIPDVVDPEISIVPNPNSGLITIHLNNISRESISFIKLYDSSGMLCIGQFRDLSIDMGHLNSGLYFIIINIKGKLYRWKIIKS